MKQFSCVCVKTDGKLRLLDPDGYQRYVESLGDGEEVNGAFEEVGRKRTNAQNRFFHGPILSAFMTLGYRQQEAKDLLCLRFIPQEVTTLDGFVVRVPGHTSALTVPEFNALIESCIQLAAENDIYIQDAEEWRLAHATEAA